MHPSIPKNARVQRAGFTLIELLMAIAIIALLIGLLLPAISAVQTRGRVAQVVSEIKALEGALTEFNTLHGRYPPSRIHLYETRAGWFPPASAPTADKTEANRSRTYIRAVWQQFNFDNPQFPANFFANAQTRQSDGEKYIELNGSECLVFFLGGVKNADGALSGFSTIPTRPFDNTSTGRVTPFFNFVPDRLIDSNGNGVPEYVDPLSGQLMPYIYYSSYDGKGYRDADVTGGLAYYKQSSTTAWSPDTFQIISPGFDFTYGPGGEFDPEKADSQLVNTRSSERDNITNFHGGLLAD